MSSDELHLIFECGERSFAVPTSRVIEIVRYQDRGDVLLVDLNQLLGGEATPIGPYTCVVVIAPASPDEADRSVGLVVDATTAIASFGASELLQPPDFGPNISLSYLASLARTAGAFCIVLDTQFLLARAFETMGQG